MQSKCCADDPDSDVYVDVSNSDPVHYESIQLKSLKVSESMVMCHKLAADPVDKPVKNPMYEVYSKGKDEEVVIENINFTKPSLANFIKINLIDATF